jgi:hypothetical protein
MNFLWFFIYLTEDDESIEFIMNNTLIAATATELLESNEVKIMQASLRLIGNLSSGNEDSALMFAKYGIFDKLAVVWAKF